MGSVTGSLRASDSEREEQSLRQALGVCSSRCASARTNFRPCLRSSPNPRPANESPLQAGGSFVLTRALWQNVTFASGPLSSSSASSPITAMRLDAAFHLHGNGDGLREPKDPFETREEHERYRRPPSIEKESAKNPGHNSAPRREKNQQLRHLWRLSYTRYQLCHRLACGGMANHDHETGWGSTL